MHPSVGVPRRVPWGEAWILVARLCTTVAWYLPWFTVHYGEAPYLGGPPSTGAAGPYAMASQDIHSSSVVVLLVVGVALIGLGIRSFAARRAGSPRIDAMWVTVAACVLAAAVYYALGAMAVLQIALRLGTVAPGVYLVPEPGALVMLAGIAAAMVACIRAWRRLLGR